MTADHPVPYGVTALSRGTVSITGPALAWMHRLDRAIVAAAESWGAADACFPPVIDAAHLARIDYFRSFPHLVTLPVSLPRNEGALERFTRRYAADRPLPLTEHAPVEHALLPAACYQVYPGLAESVLQRPALVTTRAGCFRREETFVPLRRQWAFTMREVVCVGTEDEVSDLLRRGQDLLVALCDGLGLRHDRAQATDPFFRPTTQGRYLYQRLHPVKHETIVDDLAIASVNRHHEHFADAFGIVRDDRPAHSGCVAFGLERWLSVAAARFGPDPEAWPDPLDALDSSTTGAGHG